MALNYDVLTEKGKKLEELFYLLKSKEPLALRNVIKNKEDYANALALVLPVLEELIKHKSL